MAVTYKAIGWNAHKRAYDRLVLGLMAAFLLVFIGLNLLLFPSISPETLIIRATASLAFLMLHLILAIGPLARLDKRFLPLLYNRRHLGVSMFLLAAVHGLFSIVQFHALGNLPALSSLFLSNLHYGSLVRFPFQTLGFFALLILFLMAATSHDFWLHQLSPRVWKALHMLVYVAYALIVMHVMLGVVQVEASPVIVGALGIGLLSLLGLHLAAGHRQRRLDRQQQRAQEDGFYKLCGVEEIPESCAKMALIEGENIAVFKHGQQLSAVNNACKHQNGPLGEGKIVNGCIVCPWHGYEYRPEDGCSPPPFQEKVATYDLRVVDGKVWVNPTPHPEGTPVAPVSIA